MASPGSPSSNPQRPRVDTRSSSLLVPISDSPPTRRTPLRTTSLASDLGLLPSPTVASSLAPPPENPHLLTPLRAHYLKRELVTLEFVRELAQLDSPGSLSILGPPFLPKSRFVDGVPQPPPASGSEAALREQRDWEANVDLPFLRFVFHHFILSFPFLIACPPTFFSHKLQPFVYSFVSRNISTSDDRDVDTKRRRIAGKVEKHLGLVMSAAVKLTENGGKEEVVRIDEHGEFHSGAPATQASAATVGMKKRGALTTVEGKDDDFSINIVSVRTQAKKSRMRIKTHEEFLVRTRRKGQSDVYVARRYGDFVRLAETVRRAFSLLSSLPSARQHVLTQSPPCSSAKSASRRRYRARRPRTAGRSSARPARRTRRPLPRPRLARRPRATRACRRRPPST